MLARSFLFKLLNFSKSSRLVLVVTVVFVNYVNANPTDENANPTVPSHRLSVFERDQKKCPTRVQRKCPAPKPVLDTFERTSNFERYQRKYSTGVQRIYSTSKLVLDEFERTPTWPA